MHTDTTATMPDTSEHDARADVVDGHDDQAAPADQQAFPFGIEPECIPF